MSEGQGYAGNDGALMLSVTFSQRSYLIPLCGAVRKSKGVRVIIVVVRLDCHLRGLLYTNANLQKGRDNEYFLQPFERCQYQDCLSALL